MFGDFYPGKRVLVTGHTGFKGGWLSLWLKRLGAEVHGLSLPAPTEPSLHEVIGPGCFESETTCDIRDAVALQSAVEGIRPELVFHLAAQPIVRRSYAEPIETFQTNALGTANLLESIRRTGLHCTTLVVTSDKCYENREWDFAYRENDPLGGHDVYSMSKAATELVARSWSRSFFEVDDGLGTVVTARAGNVIGGGDYAEDRIIPDAVRALGGGEPILVRNPAAVRPWQHVLECLSGYLWLVARLGGAGEGPTPEGGYNFGPDPASRQPVGRLVDEILAHWPGEWTDGSEPGAVHEAKLLTLSIDKAAAQLGWRPVWDFDEAVRQTIRWYKRRHDEGGDDMAGFTISQIEEYAGAASANRISWSQS